MAILSPPASGPGGYRGDREVERRLAQEVRDELDHLLSERQLLSPLPDDRERIRGLIHRHVESYQRQAAVSNGHLLRDPAATEKRIADDILGLGILQGLMDDPEVEEIAANGPGRIFAVRKGETQLVEELYFESDEDLQQLAKRLIGPLGLHLDIANPIVNARLDDGSRLNVVIPPAATRCTYLNVRKFILKAHRLEELIAYHTLTEELARFLALAVQAGVTILVSGGTAAGKTTLLNCLGDAIVSASERVVVIEDTAELQLDHLPNCASLQARDPNPEGAGEITIRQLVRTALRMRPSRLLVGEVLGGEALDMLTSINTGHHGSLTTIHANSPRDALDKLITLALMAEGNYTTEAITRMVARTIELVVQLDFDQLTNRRRVTSVFEVSGLEANTITGNELWAIDPQPDRLTWTGIQPRCLAKFRARGLHFDLRPAD